MKLTHIVLLFVLLLAGSVSAADLNKVTAAADNAFATAPKSKSAGTGTFSDFVVTVEDSTAGHTSAYRTAFTVSAGKWLAYHLDGFVFAFPDSFDLTNLQVTDLADNNPCVDFRVVDMQITGQTVAIQIRRSWTKDGEEKSASTISFTLTMDGIENPDQSGTYQLAGLAFDVSDDILAGPALSNAFHILPGNVAGITVRPDIDWSLPAGTFAIFTAYLVDASGNLIESITPTWSLQGGSDPIGTIFNTPGQSGTFQATTVGTGHVMATYGDLTATSGVITVTPGALARIDLDIPAEQLVGVPIIGPASATLYDSFGNLKTDYDLSVEPLQLLLDNGVLEGNLISDNSLLVNGTVDLTAIGMTYDGPTVRTRVSAVSGPIRSNYLPVSFSGYDILELLDAAGNPLTAIAAEARMTIQVVIQNNGLTAPSAPLTISGWYDAVPDTAYAQFNGTSNGVIDTVAILMPEHPESPVTDLINLAVVAPFHLSGQNFFVTDSVSAEITVQPPVELSLVSDTIGPDTLYPGRNYILNIAIDASGIPDTALTGIIGVKIVQPGEADGGDLYFSRFTDKKPNSDGILQFYNLVTSGVKVLPEGSYVYRVYFQATAPSGTYNLIAEANSVTLLAPVSLTYVAGSLAPTIAAAGFPVGFQFDMTLDNSYPVAFDGTASSLTVTGPDFVGSSSLIGPDTLYPGVNHFRAQQLFIPTDLSDQSLTLVASFDVEVPSVPSSIRATTDFGGATIAVTEQAVAQIVDLQIVAPNAPMVNTSQPFQAKCLVANLSGSEIAPFDLHLESDGNSTFDTVKTVPTIPSYDTVEVLFDCVAAPEPNSAEIFRVSMGPSALAYLEPINNLALVTIQTPANLEFTYTLFGAPGGVVDQNAGFGLTVEIRNFGQADATDGAYLLTTGGVEFGQNDSLTGPITIDRHVEFQFVAPSFDTTVAFVFQLTDLPLDLNTGLPAIIDSSSFVIPIRVESQDADLLVEATPLGSNLVSPGQTKDLFRLSLTNRGVSAVTSIRLTDLAVALRGRDNQPLPVTQYIDPTGTFITEDGSPVQTTVSVQDKLMVEFTNFIIPSGATREIVLTARFTNNASGEFTLAFETDDIAAVFSGGSQDGRPVRVSSSTGSPFLLSRPYVVRGHSLSESFVIENNPFNPNYNPARFSYELQEPSRIEFRVFTLTGEEVFAENIPEGAAGGLGTEQEVTWDGRNGSGDMVANGVYIVSIKIVSTGEVARMKVAVVK